MCSDEIYIIFTKAKTLGIIRKLLHPEISHCFVLWKADNQWFRYDSSVDSVDICTVSNLSDIIDESFIIRVKKQDTEGRILSLNTCVSSVKRFIGLRDSFILTPYQLFKRLNHGIL